MQHGIAHHFNLSFPSPLVAPSICIFTKRGPFHRPWVYRVSRGISHPLGQGLFDIATPVLEWHGGEGLGAEVDLQFCTLGQSEGVRKHKR